MKVYTCTKFRGRWPVPVAAVVQAGNRRSAANKLNRVLKEMGLEGDALSEDMIPFPIEDKLDNHKDVRILSDGDY